MLTSHPGFFVKGTVPPPQKKKKKWKFSHRHQVVGWSFIIETFLEHQSKTASRYSPEKTKKSCIVKWQKFHCSCSAQGARPERSGFINRRWGKWSRMWTVPSIPSTPPPWSIPQMRYHVPWLPYPTMPSVSTRRLRSWLKPWTPDDLFNPFSWKVCAVVVFFFAAVVAQGDGVGRSGTPVTCLSEALIEFPLVPEGHTLCNIQVERQKNREIQTLGFMLVLW